MTDKKRKSRPPCGHAGCQRLAVRVVTYNRPNHREFGDQTHACCAVHSRALSPTDYDYVDPPAPRADPEPAQTHPVATGRCSEPGCQATFADHRWGRTKADGWFHQRDGSSWCPEHVPDWVESWRARRAAKD